MSFYKRVSFLLQISSEGGYGFSGLVCFMSVKSAVLNLVAIRSGPTSKTTQNVGLGTRIPLRNLTLLCLVHCCPLTDKIKIIWFCMQIVPTFIQTTAFSVEVPLGTERNFKGHSIS